MMSLSLGPPLLIIALIMEIGDPLRKGKEEIWVDEGGWGEADIKRGWGVDAG